MFGGVYIKSKAEVRGKPAFVEQDFDMTECEPRTDIHRQRKLEDLG